MRLQTLLLPLLVFLPSALSNPALFKQDECPVIALKDKAECFGRTSACWSPGKGDIDCPNNGLCCFDGCVNQCRIPDVAVYVPPPVCTVEYQQREETKVEDHCIDIPDLQTCTKTEKQQCRSECRIIDQPQTVEEERKCCKTSLELVCRDAPCDEYDFHEVDVGVNQEICKQQEAFCFNRPEQECTDKNVEDCKTIQKEQCEKVSVPKRKPQSVTRTECKPKSVQKCNTIKKPKQVFAGNEQECTPRTTTKCELIKKPKTVQRSKKVCTQKTSQRCETVKKPTEWPTTKEECTTQYKEECETAYKEWCPSTTRVPYAYRSTGTPITQDRYGYRALTSTTRDRYTRDAKFGKKSYAKFGKTKFTTPVRENLRYVLPDTRVEVGCKQMPYKKCSKIPYNHCETKTTITIEYEDEEICTPYTEDICVDEPVYDTVFEEVQDCKPFTDQVCVDKPIFKTVYEDIQDCRFVQEEECRDVTETIFITEFEEVNQCHSVPERVCTQNVVTECKTTNRQECIESSRTCSNRALQEKQRVQNNCRVKDKICEYKENEQCQVTKEQVQKRVPTKVCNDVCEPVVTNVCAARTTRRDCKKIAKRMFYQVPVERC